jgi:hypothetical protein
VFCNVQSFSPSRRLPAGSITQQLEYAIPRVRRRYGAERFIAYFQPGTNTYAPPEQLDRLYREAIAHPQVVGLAVGTRPDCVPDEILDLLADLSAGTWLCVEYGLQSIHGRSLEWMNRGHDNEAFLDTIARSRRRGLRVGAHVILGLPGESQADMLATARELARLGLDTVKLHNLHAVAGTPLAAAVAAGEVPLPDRDQYVDCVVGFLEVLPPDCVIDRLSGDALPELLVAPAWCLDKPAVLRAIDAELQRRDTWQGRCHRGIGD